MRSMPALPPPTDPIWTTSTNELVTIHFDTVAPESRTASSSAKPFHPLFTYPFYTLAEALTGYIRPILRLRFNARSLLAFVEFTYAHALREEVAVVGLSEDGGNGHGPTGRDHSKCSAVEAQIQDATAVTTKGASENLNAMSNSGSSDPGAVGIYLDTPEKVMQPILEALKSHNYTTSFATYQASFSPDLPSVPPGDPIATYPNTLSSRYITVYQCKPSDSRFQTLFQRLDIFMYLFIEGASMLDHEDPKWEVYLALTDNAEVVGFVSAYRFFKFPDLERLRIAQFVIFPPYQRQGNGKRIYQAIMKRARQDPRVHSTSVEDPTEEFQTLRDVADYETLVKEDAFSSITRDKYCSVDPIGVEDCLLHILKKYKLAKKQAERVVELFCLHHLDQNSQEDVRQYRLNLKRRIFKVNKDRLRDVDWATIRDGLESSYVSNVEGYRDLLQRVGRCHQNGR